MTVQNRPLSPHLQIYRPQLTTVLSISHRISGIFLVLGMILLTYWLACLASGPEAYRDAYALVHSLLGRVVMFGLSFALFFHLCNGIRHLAWDAGYGLEIEQAYTSGKAVVAAAVALTLVAWLVALT
ncbi:MAG: succinate dehydrogenase, cytochrome b556 subunit [Pseudomonadales bacterium]|nr:succinate dehydrogenase, cytochrome b556 subunit [Pseudomonadales bacterium]